MNDARQARLTSTIPLKSNDLEMPSQAVSAAISNLLGGFLFFYETREGGR
jgi:hypothetical protein